MEPLATPHWIVFDLDDTIALTEQFSAKVFVDTLRQELVDKGKPVPTDFAAFREYLIASYRTEGCAAITMATIHGMDAAWVESIYEKSAAASHAAVLQNLAPVLHTTAALQALKAQGHHLHILTLGHKTYAEPVLRHLGLHAIFAPHIHARAFKRVAAPYLALLSTYPQLATLPKIMVEDSPANLIPAKALGFTTIGIGHKTLGHPAVDHYYPTITAFLNALL